jgi:Domain of unknown function (DUF4397)
MNKKISIFIAAAILLWGCGKENVTSNVVSTAMFINAAPGNTTHNVILDGIGQTGTALVFRAASPYLNIAVGSRKINLRSNNLALPVDYANFQENFNDNAASTFVAYDILASPTGTLKTVRFNDNLTAPKTGFIKFRLLPLAIGAPAIDVTYLRTSNVAPTLADSVTVSNLNYIGTSPTTSQIESLSAFTELPAGNYTIKVKQAGTQTVLTSSTFAPTIAGAPKGIYTFFATGNLPTVPLALNVARNFP